MREPWERRWGGRNRNKYKNKKKIKKKSITVTTIGNCPVSSSVSSTPTQPTMCGVHFVTLYMRKSVPQQMTAVLFFFPFFFLFNGNGWVNHSSGPAVGGESDETTRLAKEKFMRAQRWHHFLRTEFKHCHVHPSPPRFPGPRR